MSIRFATILLVAFFVLAIDVSAATITLYPTVDQSAEDIVDTNRGLTEDGVFDWFHPNDLNVLNVVKLSTVPIDVRSVMEFPEPVLPENTYITNVTLHINIGNTINHDDPRILVYGYSANGFIEPNDFLLDKPFFGAISGYDDFPDGGFPPAPNFRDLDITAAYLQNTFPRLGLTFTTNDVYPFAPAIGSTDNVSPFPFSPNPNYARPALIITYSTIPEPPTCSLFLAALALLPLTRFLSNDVNYSRRSATAFNPQRIANVPGPALSISISAMDLAFSLGNVAQSGVDSHVRSYLLFDK